jgi:hydrogenase maturation protease
MIAVVGCGSLNRSDDAVGVEAVRALRERGPRRSWVKLLDAGTDGMAVMFGARGCSTLIVIDCCRTGVAPGTLFEVPGEALEQAHQPSLNLHDFRWDHALHAGRRIFREAFPRDVVVLLVEGGCFELGLGLGAEVRAALDRVCARVEALIEARAA